MEGNLEMEQPRKGVMWRLQGIFFEPVRTFEAIRRRPTFLAPMILSVLIGVAGAYVLYSNVDMARVMEEQIRSSPAGDRMTQEEIEQQVRTVTESQAFQTFKWVGPLIGGPFMIVFLAGLILLLAFLSGGETTFQRTLGVSAHAFFAYSAIYTGLTILVLYLTANPTAVNIENPIFSNPGPLFSRQESPVLYRIASALDLISFYAIFLLGLGLSKVSTRTSTAKGVLLVTLAYALYVAIGVGWRLIFG